MPIPLVVFNLLLFVGLGWYVLVVAARAPSASVRLLWRLAVLPIAAIVIGGIQRLAVQAVRVGWLPEETLDLLLDEYQTVQSLVVAAIGIVTFLVVRRLAIRFTDLEVVTGDMVDRVKGIDLDTLRLTRREHDVLEVLGAGTMIDDRTLAEKLMVSPATVHTHVNSLLKKTKLRDRRDLVVVAFLLRTQEGRGGLPREGEGHHL